MNVVEKEFNTLATKYETNRLSDWYKAHSKEMQEHCINIEDGDILDVGCGTGYFLRQYLKDKPQTRAVGIDCSSTMIEQATEKAATAGLNQINFIHADWENFDATLLKDYKFKAIFCANTFHYFTKPQSATDKLFKELSDGGALYILERNKTLSLLTFIWGFIHKALIKDQVIFYKTSDLVDFLKNARLTQIKTLSTIRKYFWKRKLFTSIVLIESQKQKNK